jgi:FHA domain-containing protein
MEFNARSGAMADPFADLLDPRAAKPQVATAGQHDDFSDLGLPSGGLPASIDAMFGLGLGAAGSDPFAQSPLAAPLMQPNTASAADPLAALQRQAKPSAAAQSDHVPALQHAFVTGPTKPPPQPVALPMDDFSDLLGPPSAPAPQPAPAPAPAAVLQRVEIGLMADPAPHPSPLAVLPAVAAVSLSPGQYSDADLLAAFLKGVNSAHQMPVALTPGLMERIGSMLRSATEGTLQLLMTRQELKREVRAEVTMIGSQHNNPLKFSPTVEVALAHLLGPGVRGFMPAQEAMQDAFNDLRAHQIGVMVGLQAALGHVLTRFTPDQLEKRLTEKSTFDALFSAGRKAKLWDQFRALHASISQEAEEDFHKLFGEAFSKAYEEQMSNLKSGTDKR